MRLSNLALTLLATAVLAGCGGSSPRAGDQTLKAKYSSLVSFGDSLSDVGTYNVGTVKTLGGGKFTINGAGAGELTGKNWIELMTAQLGLPAACPAQTGLNGQASLGFSVPVTNNTGCFAYGQGGARISNPVGTGNAANGSPVGALTVPVSQQIQNHLSRVGGSFKGDELVIVMAGGNDIVAAMSDLGAKATAAGKTTFANALVSALAKDTPNPATAAQAIGLAMQTEAAKAGSTDTSVATAAVGAAAQAGNTLVVTQGQAYYGPIIVAAQTAANAAGQAYFTNNASTVVTTMAAAGTELAGLVKTQIVGKGAKRVALVNLPDVANTPYALANTAEVRGLVDKAVAAFNTSLAAGVSGDASILLIDAFAVNHDQIVNPGPYGLTNVKDKACDTTPAKNPLGNSLGCTVNTLVAGDTAHWLFADDLHPTPFGYKLLARYVSEKLVVAGWI